MPSSESCAVLMDKLLQRHRRAAADLFDEIIRASEDAVLEIKGDFTQMLDDKGVSRRLRCRFECAIQCARVMSGRWFMSARCHQLPHRVNAHLLVVDVFLQYPFFFQAEDGI